MGYGAVRPSAQNNDQVRRARGKAHVLIKGFSESLPRYALIQLRFECSKECFYTCTDQVIGSDDVAASDNIGVLNRTPG